MIIAAKGTNNRRVLDYLFGRNGLTKTSVFTAIGDVPRPALEKIIESEIDRGFITIYDGRLFLTTSANEAYAAEKKNKDDNFKPRGKQPSWRDTVTRNGSADFMNIPSRHN